MAITGKQRSQRIDRNYTASIDPSILWKRRLSWLALALGLAYGFWILTPSGAKQMSAGPLSRAHHAWNDTGCENCHAVLSPIKTTSFGRTPQAIVENNRRCNSCHQVQDHYPAQTQPAKLATESCVQCHHEHLGLNHNLLDIADESCVRCHKDLSLYAMDTTKKHPKITSFDLSDDGTGHPEFRGLSVDQGTISFSHIQHMRPGQPATPGDRSAKTFVSLTPRYKQQYQGREDPDGLVQLTCNDCHSLSNEGGLYQPIEFDKHCQACHELDVPHKLDLTDVNALKDTIGTVELQFFNRLNRNENLQSINERAGEKFQVNDPLLHEKSQQTASGKNLVELLESNVLEAKTEIFKSYGCGKCHQEFIETVGDGVPSMIVKASGLKGQWLNTAHFTHSAHGSMQCNTCHRMELDSPAKPNDPNPPRGGNAHQVLIDGIENCRSCHIVNEAHRSLAKTNGQMRVATADCIDCHRFHHTPSRQAP